MRRHVLMRAHIPRYMRSGCSCSVVHRRGSEVLIVSSSAIKCSKVWTIRCSMEKVSWKWKHWGILGWLSYNGRCCIVLSRLRWSISSEKSRLTKTDKGSQRNKDKRPERWTRLTRRQTSLRYLHLRNRTVNISKLFGKMFQRSHHVCICITLARSLTNHNAWILPLP